MSSDGNGKDYLPRERAEDAENVMDAMICLRCPKSIKNRAVKTANKKRVNLQDYIIQLIDEDAVKLD